MKLPDGLKDYFSGETESFGKKRLNKNNRTKVQEEDKTKKTLADKLYENTLDPTYEENISKFNEDFDMDLLLLDSEQD